MGIKQNISDQTKQNLKPELLRMNLFLAFDFTNFVGRFHPILVHLPIGFLLLGILMEWYQRWNKTEKLSNLIAYAWLLGAIGGALHRPVYPFARRGAQRDGRCLLSQ